MSPILVRPVREQLEHDRVIRLLQAKYKRKSEVAINPGSQQTMPVAVGTSPWFPDLVLYASEKNRKILGIVEVETVESVNNLEAMSQWATFSRLKVPFHLYVPVQMVDVARRMCQDLLLTPPEVWTYQAIGEQLRFALVQKGALEFKGSQPSASPPKAAAPKAAAPKAAAPNGEKAAKSVVTKPAPAKSAVAKPAAKPAKAVAARPQSAVRRPAAPPPRLAKVVKPKAPVRAVKPARKAAASGRGAKRR